MKDNWGFVLPLLVELVIAIIAGIMALVEITNGDVDDAIFYLVIFFGLLTNVRLITIESKIEQLNKADDGS